MIITWDKLKSCSKGLSSILSTYKTISVVGTKNRIVFKIVEIYPSEGLKLNVKALLYVVDAIRIIDEINKKTGIK